MLRTSCKYGEMARETTVILASLVLTCAGCTPGQEGLSEKEQALAAALEISEELMLEAKRSGENLRQLEGVDADGNTVLAAGVTIDVARAKALPAVRRLQRKAGVGYFAFISEENFGIKGAPDQVSLLKASDPYDMLRTMGTNGWNYHISPDMVIARLKEWDARFGITLHGVGFDWLEFQFKHRPESMLEYAQEVYRFCPDIVEQGTGTVEALAREMRRTNMVFLWWD
jgi:hypothetical protein